MLQIDILRNGFPKDLGVLRGDLWGFRCSKDAQTPSLDFQAVICHMFFLLPGTKYSWWPQWSIQFTLISPFSLCMSKSYIDLRIRWCHLSTIPGTTPHCLVSTGGDVNFLETRNLVYQTPCWLKLCTTQNLKQPRQTTDRLAARHAETVSYLPKHSRQSQQDLQPVVYV